MWRSADRGHGYRYYQKRQYAIRNSGNELHNSSLLHQLNQDFTTMKPSLIKVRVSYYGVGINAITNGIAQSIVHLQYNNIG